MWRATINTDTGSLRVGDVVVRVGDRLQIRSEGAKVRIVTYVMGRATAGTLHACFRGQGACPLGPQEWRFVENSTESGPDRPAARATRPVSSTTLPAPAADGAAGDDANLAIWSPARVTSDRVLLMVGFDSAWTAGNSGGITAVIVDADGPRCVLEPENVTFAQAAALLDALLDAHPAVGRLLVALDQPLIVENATGRRPADAGASRIVARFGSATQPANRKRETMFGDDAPIWAFLAHVRQRFPDLSLDPLDWTKDDVACVVTEVYPVLSLLSFFPGTIRRKRVLRYNPQRKTFDHADWRALGRGLADAFDVHELPSLAEHCRDAARGNVRKAVQDRLDACICLLIGLHLTSGAPSGVIGDMASGTIVFPVHDDLRPVLRVTAAAGDAPLRFVDPPEPA